MSTVCRWTGAGSTRTAAPGGSTCRPPFPAAALLAVRARQPTRRPVRAIRCSPRRSPCRARSVCCAVAGCPARPSRGCATMPWAAIPWCPGPSSPTWCSMPVTRAVSPYWRISPLSPRCSSRHDDEGIQVQVALGDPDGAGRRTARTSTRGRRSPVRSAPGRTMLPDRSGSDRRLRVSWSARPRSTRGHRRVPPIDLAQYLGPAGRHRSRVRAGVPGRHGPVAARRGVVRRSSRAGSPEAQASHPPPGAAGRHLRDCLPSRPPDRPGSRSPGRA